MQALPFISSGIPKYLIVNAGIECIDISSGIKYRQVTIPYGDNWREVSKGNVATTDFLQQGTVNEYGGGSTTQNTFFPSGWN